MYRLDGQTALVTGGAKGIGKEICTALGLAGAKVVIGDMDPESGFRTCEELEQSKIPCKFFHTDVTKEGDVSKFVSNAAAHFGSVDILVNNAGILADKFITDITVEEWDNMLQTHLKGTFLTCRAVIPQMIEQEYGKIINIASLGGRQGFPFAGVHYCAAKGGIMAFTRQLAQQVSRYNIHVNCVAPGTTETEMIKNRSEEQKSKITKSIPLGRMGTPSDTANAVLFLASFYADFIAGETVDVNGGKFMV